MNIKKTEETNLSSRNIDDTESPRKKMRLDSQCRRSWSLMDRKTDHEVLQEMGVSLLDPDDSEVLCDAGASGMPHRGIKRKRDIENVNPNINLISSPRGKYSEKSPRARAPSSPHAGPSRGRSPRSDTHKPLQPTDQQILETTITDEYLVDEETPLAQSVSAGYLPSYEAVSTGSTEKYSRTCPPASPPRPLPPGCSSGRDAFSALSDEMLLSVFRWLHKRTLASAMLVCKRWHRVACDETLWQRLDLGNKNLSKDALGRILARQPVIVRLASSEIGPWHPAGPALPSRLQFLDLSMASIDLESLQQLLLRCPSLRKLSLESVPLDRACCRAIGQCNNLETLNLTMAQGITAEGLESILDGCPGLLSLNISWCNLDEEALEVLVTKLPQKIQRLNIGGARLMTDETLERLSGRGARLLELDASDCGRLTPRCVAALCRLPRLEHLALSRCYLLPLHALTQLAGASRLQHVDVWGMLHAHALSALRAALPHVQVNSFMFSAIARPTVGTRRTSIWGLRTRD
ncbi:S-phase kinase-associated protein 2-like isoform X2 [Trichoplusia ni]|uniref:S-phase kinase-associated protein 2-like isoform X2 n=2 Tax=Trichoplusia ni TaxID=7111 RepID=A0A7E5V8A5_TRINI|nr:S-phase kinase-associated protein 2-like isoform X2 [Trichoplusia ni]